MIRIGHLTDIHVPDFADFRKRDFLSKRVTGLVNFRLKRADEYSLDVLRAGVARLVDERPDLVLVTGDLSNLGLQSEWVAAQGILQPLVDAGIRVGVIPGNHDYYVPGSAHGAFEQAFRTFQWADAKLTEPYPFVMRAGPVSVLMLNSSLPTLPMFAYGRVSQAQLDRVVQLGEIERDKGQTLVVALHHHPVPAPHRKVDFTRDLKDAAAVRAVCASLGAALVLHGHNHFFDTRRIASETGPFVVGLSSGTTTRQDRPERRAQVGLYTLDASGLQRVQVANWSPEPAGFSPWTDVSLQAPVIAADAAALS